MKFLLFIFLLFPQFAKCESLWSYATPVASPITNTTAVELKAAPATSQKIHLQSVQVFNNHGTVSSLVGVYCGSRLVFTGYSMALGSNPLRASMPSPIKCLVGENLNVAAVTTGSSIFVSAQGFVGL